MKMFSVKRSCLPSGKLSRSLTSSIYSMIGSFKTCFKSNLSEGEKVSARSWVTLCHSSITFIKFTLQLINEVVYEAAPERLKPMHVLNSSNSFYSQESLWHILFLLIIPHVDKQKTYLVYFLFIPKWYWISGNFIYVRIFIHTYVCVCKYIHVHFK